MGSAFSTPPLPEPFSMFQFWAHARTGEMLHTYKTNDYEFGIDTKIVAILIGGDQDWANEIVEKFAVDGSSIINALSFISGIIAIANHGTSKPSLLEEKISLVFDAFDFDGTGNMTMDELTILFLSSLRALVVITGQGTEPSDDECEQISIKAFNFVGRQLSSPITRDEFVRYVTFTVGSDCEDLETALIGFGILDIPSMPEPQIEIYAAISHAHPDFTAKISNEAQVPPPDDDMSASLTHHAAEATLSNPMTPRETNLNFSPSAEAPCAAAPNATDAPATAEAAGDAPAAK